MILSGSQISALAQKLYTPLNSSGKCEISIEPFNLAQVNPNSYNLRLSDKLLYTRASLDCKEKPEFVETTIPENGYLLLPNTLYLASTIEYTETRGLVPIIDGRSSIGRLGLFIHVTAGYGDNGFCGHWTLELACVVPLVIYAGMEICQIRYMLTDPNGERYNGKYQYTESPQPSRIWKEFE